jgi:predicted ATPase/DNA-binding SARP family transcriptional activator
VAGDRGVSFRLLGAVEALDAGGTPLALGSPRCRAVLAALLLHRGTSLPVQRAVELLWPNGAPGSAVTMVHGAVASLRRTLEGEGRPRVLLTRDGGYVLDVAADQVDAARFEQALDRARRELDESPQRAVRLVTGALAQWHGPALAGVEEPFARAAARRLEDRRVEARELRVDAELRSGHHREVLGEIADLVAEHPLREDLCAHLVVALYRCGRQADALDAHRRLRAALAEELGVEPEESLRDLELAVLRHDPALRPPAVGSGALPAPLGSLEGRVRDLDDVGGLLRAHRLVTLTGPGGVGKTRLATEVARRSDAEVRLVDLAPLSDPALLEEALADAVGVHAEPGQPLARTIGAALGTRTVLLVLDNTEHLVAACAALVSTLLAVAAPLRVLVTSREPLRVPGERVHVVRPLAVPREGASSEETAASPAVRLFCERATAAGVSIAPAVADLVGELCRRLDGLPLAIELAAARAATLPLRDLVDRLDGRYALLDAAARPADPRHRSLAATVEWGHALLGAEEQALFARLAVFRGGFDLRAATAVGAGVGDVALPVARLVASSMVQRDDRPDGTARFRLLETMRAFAADRLTAPARSAADERHAAHYLGRAQDARDHLFAPASGPWLDALHAEQDNLRAALTWSFAADPDRGVRLVDCLWHYWDLRGARDEGLHWVHTALAAVGPDVGARLPLLSAGALLHLGRADLAETERLAGEELAAARAAGDARWEGDALALLATVDWARGRYDRARQRYEDGVPRSLAAGDLWRAAMAQAQLARLHCDRREPDAARAVGLRALEHAETVGEGLARGLARDVLASTEQRWGDPGEAARLGQEALGLYREVGYAEGEASALRLVAVIALDAGRLGEAGDAFRAALGTCRRIGHRAGTAEALEGLADVAVREGDGGAAALGAEAASLRAVIGIPGPRAGRDEPRLARG